MSDELALRSECERLSLELGREVGKVRCASKTITELLRQTRVLAKDLSRLNQSELSEESRSIMRTIAMVDLQPFKDKL